MEGLALKTAQAGGIDNQVAGDLVEGGSPRGDVGVGFRMKCSVRILAEERQGDGCHFEGGWRTGIPLDIECSQVTGRLVLAHRSF